MKSVRKLAICNGAALLLFLAARPAAAAPIVYFGADDPRGSLANSLQAQADFVAALDSHGTDTLESFANNTFAPNLAFGGTGITGTAPTGLVVTFALLATSGSNAMLDAGPQEAEGAAIPDVFTFSEPVTAFGAFASNGGDASANTITLVLENTLLATSQNVVVATLGPGASFNNALFFGVTDTVPFDRVTIVESFDFDGILFDDISVGHARVPEPGALALAGIAAVVFAAVRRWRR